METGDRVQVDEHRDSRAIQEILDCAQLHPGGPGDPEDGLADGFRNFVFRYQGGFGIGVRETVVEFSVQDRSRRIVENPCSKNLDPVDDTIGGFDPLLLDPILVFVKKTPGDGLVWPDGVDALSKASRRRLD